MSLLHALGADAKRGMWKGYALLLAVAGIVGDLRSILHGLLVIVVCIAPALIVAGLLCGLDGGLD